MVMAPWVMHDSAVSPCFHGCLAFPTTVSSLTSPWSISQQSTAALTLGLLHILNSSTQLQHLLKDQHPCPGYVWLQQGLSDSHSIYAATDQLFHSQP